MGIDREKVIQNAQKLVEKKKYDKAIVEYQRLVQEDPNDARTILKIGDLQARMEAYGDAIATYEKVGKFYSTQGFSAKAIAVYKQIKEIIAKHVPHLEERYAHITPRLAEIYEHMGLVADAVGAWDEVVAKQQAAGRENEALETMRHIVSLDTNNPFSHLKLAEGLSKVRQTDEAVSVFAETAAILAKLGRRDDALKVLERLLHHKADSAHARVAAEMYLTRGQANDAMLALSKLQICFQANPKDLDTLGLLARAFNAIGQSSKAIEVQKEAARIARDQNRMDVFDEIVTYLIEMAPDDIEVRRLAGFEPEEHDGDVNHARSQQPSAYELSDDDAVEDLDDSAFEEVDEAFVMDEDQDILAAGRDDAAQAGPISEEFVATELPPTSTEDPFAQSDFGMEPANAFEEPQGQNGFAYSSSIEDADYAEDAFASGQVEEAFIDVSEPPRAGVDEAALARVLADVASFQRAKLWGRAIDLLVGAKERFPRSTELSQTLAQVYSEAGRPEDAVNEMLDLAAMLIDGLDGDAAAQVLQDVLAYDPVNGDAIRMLRDLGYEVIEEEEAPAPQPFVPPVYGLDSDDVGADANDGSFGSNAPLPAYELEGDGLDDGEIHPLSGQTNGGGSPSFVHGPTAAYPGVATAGRNGRFSSLPAGENLPSFALERNAAASASRGAVLGSDLPSFGETGLSAAPPVNISKAPNSLTFADLEDALEESEFFASRGLFQDARTILMEQLERLPNHPLLLERLQELDIQEQESSFVLTGRQVSERYPSAQVPGSLANFTGSNRDIADAIEAFRSAPNSAVPRSSRHPEGAVQVDVEDVFAKFKEGVAKQISVDDAQAHYDLGVAYKEMALVEDAVREFGIAARDPRQQCVCQNMIGVIEIERGNLNGAIAAFLKGLDAPIRTPEQETTLEFEVGSAYEAKKMFREALDYYTRVRSKDPAFRDVQMRIERLNRPERKSPSVRPMANADDEFDRAFDDLFTMSRNP